MRQVSRAFPVGSLNGIENITGIVNLAWSPLREKTHGELSTATLPRNSNRCPPRNCIAFFICFLFNRITRRARCVLDFRPLPKRTLTARNSLSDRGSQKTTPLLLSLNVIIKIITVTPSWLSRFANEFNDTSFARVFHHTCQCLRFLDFSDPRPENGGIYCRPGARALVSGVKFDLKFRHGIKGVLRTILIYYGVYIIIGRKSIIRS